MAIADSPEDGRAKTAGGRRSAIANIVTGVMKRRQGGCRPYRQAEAPVHEPPP